MTCLHARMTAIVRHGRKDKAIIRPLPRAALTVRRGDAWPGDVAGVRGMRISPCRRPAAADPLVRSKVVSRAVVTRGGAVERRDGMDLPDSVVRPTRPDVTALGRRTTIQGAPLMVGAA